MEAVSYQIGWIVTQVEPSKQRYPATTQQHRNHTTADAELCSASPPIVYPAWLGWSTRFLMDTRLLVPSGMLITFGRRLYWLSFCRP